MLMVVAVIPKTTLVIVSVELDEAEEDMLRGVIGAVRRCRKRGLDDISSNEDRVDRVMEMRQPFWRENHPF